MPSGIPSASPATSWRTAPTIRSLTPRHRPWILFTRTEPTTTQGWHWMLGLCAVVLAWTALGHTATTLTATTAEHGSALKKYSEITGLCHG